ncbi:hypothetical protein PIB30_098520, partial [Stylosanthes scabra]|nr:hypothetical protein [Stylosanthes scabra]
MPIKVDLATNSAERGCSCDCYGHIAKECNKNKTVDNSASLAVKDDLAPPHASPDTRANLDGNIFKFSANHGMNNE